MKVSIIVAAAENGVIGKQGSLPWRLPSELARFKQVTMGHPIVMGRKTHESIGRALPGRQNIIITRDKTYEAVGCTVVGSIDEALQAAEGADEVFIIGGASIYEQSLDLADTIYLTRVKAAVKGDKYFKFDEKSWRKISSEEHPADQDNKYAFELQKWVRQ